MGRVKQIMLLLFLLPLMTVEGKTNESSSNDSKVAINSAPKADTTAFDDPCFIAKLGALGVPLTKTGKINVLDPITLDSLSSIKIFGVSEGEGDIKSLKGIEYLINLEQFVANNRLKLDSLNMSANKRLKTLYCGNINLKFLDVSGCANLKDLDCCDSQLEELNLSANSKLKWLMCIRNRVLQHLNISGCVALTSLTCDYNSLNSLDLSTNVNLMYLECSYNKLLNLDLSNNKKLNRIVCTYNYMDSIDISMIPPFVGYNQLEFDFHPQILPSAINDKVIDSNNCPNSNAKIIAREDQEWGDASYEH